MVHEIVRWNQVGKTNAEIRLLDFIHPGEIKRIDGKKINEVITLRNAQSGKDKINFLANEKKDYYIYYNIHPTSGYKTIFDKENIRSFTIEEPKGFSFSAFFSEVVILEELGIVLSFKPKEKVR